MQGLEHLADEELLGAVADGDAEALRCLHDRHAAWLLSRMRRRCGDDDVAREALQDTFVAVWRGAGGWAGTGSVAAWLWGIASRRLVGVLRHRQRWIPVTDREVADVAVELDTARVELEPLHAAVALLDPRRRQAVRLTYLQGLSMTEAGLVLGIPAGTVKTRVMRAKTELRAALG